MNHFPFSQNLKRFVSAVSLIAAVTAFGAVGPDANVHRDGTNVVVRFTGRLQSSRAANGPFSSVAGARSPFLVEAARSTNKFWRSVLTDVRSIAAGDGFSMAIRNDGTLWTWGANNYGQLGLGHTNYSVEPAQVGTDTNWRTVSVGAGAYHALAIRDDGSLWAWGDNRFGQLGLGHTNGVTVPTQVGTETIWESVSAGWLETFALRTDGTLWAWGDNRHGQLGLESTNAVPVALPVQLGSDSDWKSIAASRGMFQPGQDSFLIFAHCLGLKENGTLWAWGNNQRGQLGLETYAEAAPFGVWQPTRVGTATNWQTIASGGYHSVALRQDGEMWVWGANHGDQLGMNLPSQHGDYRETNQPVVLGAVKNWRILAAGGHFSMAIRSDGSLWAWGDSRG